MHQIGPLPTFESFLVSRVGENRRFRDKWEKLEFFLEDVERLSQSMEEKYDSDFKAFYDEGTESIELSFIGVSDEKRGKGIASGMMNELCDYADRYGLPVRLYANDELGTSIEVLTRFYKKYGFVDKRKFVEGVGRLMVRSPK